MAWHQVAKVEELLEEEVVPVTAGKMMIALVKLDEQIHGVGNICTHEFALMSDGIVEDGCIECPLHQARFDVRTGERHSGPACADLPTYPVRIENGLVYVECTSGKITPSVKQ